MQNQVDIQNLKKYPEYYAFKQQVEKFCDTLNDISDLDIQNRNGVSIEAEVFGRRWASEKVRDFLYEMGMAEKGFKKIDKTFE